MSRAKLALYTVGMLVLSLAGCATGARLGGTAREAVDDAVVATLSLSKVASEGQVFYYSSVSLTTQILQEHLRALGLSATVTEEAGGMVRIASATPTGSHFALVIRQQTPAETTGSTGQHTRVTLEWEKNAGNQQDFARLAELEGTWRSKTQARNK